MDRLTATDEADLSRLWEARAYGKVTFAPLLSLPFFWEESHSPHAHTLEELTWMKPVGVSRQP